MFGISAFVPALALCAAPPLAHAPSIGDPDQAILAEIRMAAAIAAHRDAAIYLEEEARRSRHLSIAKAEARPTIRQIQPRTSNF